jgi:hypothetical protein
VSTYQAAVLLCFESVDTCTVLGIRDVVQCEQPFLSQVLISLLKAKILTLQNETEQVEEKALEDASLSIKLNLAFKR